ncbi:MAG: histidine phosphatase family protein [Tissierellales bacterium]|nr:histidine phosphatase family protein [Tissierellales bacterium]
MKNIKKIYLIRHCEPELFEKSSICLGRKDIPLSIKGFEQAKNLRKILSILNIEAIYTSPLSRALKTAEIISNRDIRYEIIDNFTELDVGKWDGMSFDEIKEKYPKEYEERGKNLETYIIEEGESISSCKDRRQDISLY